MLHNDNAAMLQCSFLEADCELYEYESSTQINKLVIS
jgi:hypothetical protein